MKNRTAFLLLTLLLSLLLLLSVGCQSARPPSSYADDTAETTEPETTASISTEVEYHLVYDTVEFISDEEKEAWRPYLIQRMSYIKGYTDDMVPEGQYAIEDCQFYALFDLNLDGVPELLGGMGNFGSGFSPVYPYCFPLAYDLYTGAKIASQHLSVSDNTAIYYDVDRGCYKVYSINYESTRIPGQEIYGGNYTIDRVEVLYEFDWRIDTGYPIESLPPYIVSTTYLATDISIKGMVSAESSEENPNSYRYTDILGDPHYIKDGEPCKYHEYYKELLHFMSTNILLHDTKLQYVSPHYGDDSINGDRILENAEKWADQLLSLDQQFVRPIQRENTPDSEANQ